MERTVGTVEEFKNCLGVEDSIHDSYTLEMARTHIELIEPYVREIYSKERQYDWKKEVEACWSLWDLGEIEDDLLNEDTGYLKEVAVREGLRAEDWYCSKEEQYELADQITDYLDAMPIGEFYAYYLKLEKDCYLMF